MATHSVTARDIGGVPAQLLYQFLVNGVIMQDWSILPVFNYEAASDEHGEKSLTVNILDTTGEQIQHQTSIYIYRKLELP